MGATKRDGAVLGCLGADQTDELAVNSPDIDRTADELQARDLGRIDSYAAVCHRRNTIGDGGSRRGRGSRDANRSCSDGHCRSGEERSATEGGLFRHDGIIGQK